MSPLSQSQLGIFYACQDLGENDGNYQVPLLYKLPDFVDVNKLKHALELFIKGHSYILSKIVLQDDVLMMQPSEFSEDIVEIKEIKSLDEVRPMFCSTMNLMNDRLFRMEIYKTPSVNYLYLDFHHIIVDGSSWSVLMTEIGRAYDTGSVLGEIIDGAEIANEELKLRQSDEWKTQREWYLKEFANAEDTDSMPVPSNIDRTDNDRGLIETNFQIPVKLETIESICLKHNVKESIVFTAAWGKLLANFTAENKAFFGNIYTGRTDKRTRQAMTMMVHTMPVFMEMPSEKGIDEWLNSVAEQQKATREKSAYSFSDIHQDLNLRSDIIFAYHGRVVPTTIFDFYLNGTQVKGQDLRIARPGITIDGQLLVTPNATESSDYNIRISYKSSLYSAEMIAEMAESYAAILNSMAKAETIGNLECVSEKQLNWLDKQNPEKPLALPDGKFVIDFFNENVENQPNNECCVFEDRRYTYKQIGELTDGLAAMIQHKVNRKGNEIPVVSFVIPRNEMMVIVPVAIVKAGCTYQPLDSSYPKERLNFMVKDAETQLLICTEEFKSLIDEYNGNTLVINDLNDIKTDAKPVRNDIKLDDTFILLYTSGTTGTPKGVMLTQRNILALSLNHTKEQQIDKNSCIAAYASYGFDAYLMDLWAALTSGAALHIISEEIRYNLVALHDYFENEHVTHAFMTTQVGTQLALNYPEMSSMKVLFVGGEKLASIDPPRYRFINGYGPTETLAYVASYDVSKNEKNIPIGYATKNARLYVVNKDLQRVPMGAIGELLVSGAQTSKGYLKQPEKTAVAFIDNPFSNGTVGFSKVYRTGDIVRYREDGAIEFIGRKDGQVKINGFRVELKEIESLIREYQGIKDVTVNAFDLGANAKAIAAYIVSQEKIDTELLKNFIRKQKPPYMVPAAIMQLDAIPYTVNQKVDKRALPVPQFGGDSASQMPENETQQQIFDIAKQILGHGAFGIDSNLFEVGLNSIGAIKLNVELGKKFNKPIKISNLKELKSIKAIEEFFNKNEETKAYSKQCDYPLMRHQLGVLLDTGVDKASLDYNIPLLMRISEKVDIDRLQMAVCQAIDAHHYIKMTLQASKTGEFRAIRNDNVKPQVDVVKVKKLPSEKELILPFKILEGQLYRAKIYLTDDGNYLFIDVHHIVSDGTSFAILLNDINLAYNGEELKTEYFTGFEAALEEEQLRNSDEFISSKSYFDSLLKGCNTECLPGKCAENESEKEGCAKHSFSFDESSSKIIEYCKKYSFTLNAFFNAVFGYTLSEFIHSEDVTYCTIYNGRNDSRLANSFLMAVKTIPVRCFVNEKSSVIDFIKKTQNQIVSTISNDLLSFAEISKDYGVKPDIFFNYQGDGFEFDNIGGEKAKMIDLNFTVAKAPISIEVFLENGKFVVKSTYRTDYFCADFIESFVNSLATVASYFAECEQIKQVPLMSDKELQHFNEMNETDRHFENISVHKFIERWAEKTPDCFAVKTKNSSLTFKQLNEKSNSVANKLLKLGVGKEKIVGIILDRNEFVPVAEIGIIKAGGAFLTMLPTYPDDRLDFCMQNAECCYVISTKEIIESHKDLFSNSKSYNVLDIEKLISEGETTNPNVNINPDQLAYCIYTSGSTGTPKGVMIEHHNWTNFLQSENVEQYTEKGNCIFCISSFSFDMSLSEMFVALTHGKTAYIATEEEIHNFDAMLSAFINNGVDMLMMTPSFAWTLLTLPIFEKALANIQAIILGAEAFQPALFDKLKSLNPNMLIVNGYGPTECTQACSFKKVTEGRNITIGGPMTNTKYYVMDANGHLLPRYAVGELMICGEGVGRGYVKLPEKNAASFTEIFGVRAYHSGDLVRINRDNEVEFGGRADNQVKLRGFRIELDEVEAVMQEFDGVIQSKVIVRNNGTEDYLAGFFTAEKDIDIEELTAFMRKKLTYYMVPAAMMQLEKMPITVNGKLDKKALPEIRQAVKNKVKRVPKKSLEERILELFRSVLKLDECYVDDNFFEIGGTSLSASNVVMQIKSEGYKIEYQDIFDHQTAEDLANYLESQRTADKPVVTDDSNNRQETWISEQLKYNTLEYASEVKRQPLGDVLLTGSTGFLGNHILKDLIENENGRIICLMRKGDFESLANRLQSMLFYYFENRYEDAFKNRIVLIEGDITDNTLGEKLKDVSFDTLINCAACVKHYANDNSIEFVNVHGVENLISLCKQKNAKMIQISTTSIPGAHNDETYKINLRMTEDKLFVVDDMNNQYIRSKYKAELLMLEAIRGGMRGKIVRVGNLMGRHKDGEFQINMRTNAFLNGLRGFFTIGKCPISHSTDPMSFSPIDCTARAVVLLAGTNDKFTAFNADNRYSFDEMKLVDSMNQCGLPIIPVPDEEYYADFNRMMADPEKNKRVSALLTNDRPDLHLVNTDNRFTANILYRLGFSWPFTDDNYLKKVIEALDSMGFFWM